MTEAEAKEPTYCPDCGEQCYWFGCFACHLHWGGNGPENARDMTEALERGAAARARYHRELDERDGSARWDWKQRGGPDAFDWSRWR